VPWAAHSAKAAVPSAPLDVAGADGLVATPPTPTRDRALAEWVRRRASLTDLVWLLRRPPSMLGASEAPLIEAALESAPRERAELRRRLVARLALAAPDRARRLRLDAVGPPILHPRASVFTAGVLLPDSGDYESYGAAIVEGVRAGVSDSGAPAAPRLEVETAPTGEDDPRRALAAFDSLAPRAGAVVGELLSVPTLVLAAAARYAAVPLISPTATDEQIGAMGRNVFQIGPAAFDRGARLARAVLASRVQRIGMLVSSDGSEIVDGFRAAAEGLGSSVVYEGTYPSGAVNFRDRVRAIVANRVELLFWDGEPKEAEALVRQLARERVSVRLCGGGHFAPELHHAETRVLLEGVQYVGEDWRPSEALQARLAALGGEDDDRSASLRLRGWLAGRMLARAVAQGALCPEEITAFLAARVSKESELRERGFLDLVDEGVDIPVYVVRRGEGVAR
jgi:ABC-type branched-subunit amino acid transport system substrate-binding protein